MIVSTIFLAGVDAKKKISGKKLNKTNWI
jgi:hypothetical protein